VQPRKEQLPRVHHIARICSLSNDGVIGSLLIRYPGAPKDNGAALNDIYRLTLYPDRRHREARQRLPTSLQR
jgi:hypothetical protein